MTNEVCLTWILAGRDNQSIVAELEISLRTMQSRRAHIMETLGVSNRAELFHIVIDRASKASWLKNSANPHG
jgi:DNA-binding NarL/FixJ family response regulator